MSMNSANLLVSALRAIGVRTMPICTASNRSV
jgi:hypothetical protein